MQQRADPPAVRDGEGKRPHPLHNEFSGAQPLAAVGERACHCWNVAESRVATRRTLVPAPPGTGFKLPPGAGQSGPGGLGQAARPLRESGLDGEGELLGGLLAAVVGELHGECVGARRGWCPRRADCWRRAARPWSAGKGRAEADRRQPTRCRARPRRSGRSSARRPGRRYRSPSVEPSEGRTTVSGSLGSTLIS